ncbi:MAG: VWA domain-containing protein, partial [Actinomycetota bacterium]|nr:VWA domain-containing protein [Actinomycetota bacterium]
MRRAEVAALGVGLARRLFALTLATSVVMASSLLGGRAQAQNPVEEARYQYFFLIDASGSMVGQPQGSGNAIIFPQVKENVIDLVGSLEPGTDVYIAPFHRGIQADEVLDIEVRSDEDKDALKRHVSGLNANGQVTWIYHSLASVFQIAENARKQDPGVRHVQTIYLFTDGKDNSPAGMELPEILRRFR